MKRYKKFSIISLVIFLIPTVLFAEKFVCTINLGNTSYKAELFDIASQKSIHKFYYKIENLDYITPAKTMLKELADKLDETIFACRMVHTGNMPKIQYYDNSVAEKLKETSLLAPLHNVPTTNVINLIRKEVPHSKIFIISDNAFHLTRPDKYYAISKELADKHGIYKYGFHGIAAEDAAIHVSKQLKKPLEKTNLVYFHFGGGQSVTAIKDGKSIYNSMGFSPLDGVIMLSRCGQIDPEVVMFLTTNIFNNNINATKNFLNKESGFIGFSNNKFNFNILEKYNMSQEEKELVEIYFTSVTDHIAIALSRLNFKADAIIISTSFNALKILETKIHEKFPKYKIISYKEEEELAMLTLILSYLNSNRK